MVILQCCISSMTSIINVNTLPWIAMDKSEILSAAARRNMFLSPDALEIIMSNSDPAAFVNTVLSSLANNPMFVTKDDVLSCLQGEMKVIQSPKTFAPHNKANSEIKVVEGTDITGNSTCVGDIDDFFRYFQSRYNILKKIIVSRPDFDGIPLKIKEAMNITERDTRIVGIIDDRKFTMNGHLMLTVEDDGGDKNSICKVMIKNDSPYINDIFVQDEVVGFRGKALRKESGKQPLYIADKVFKPSVPRNHKWIPSDSDSTVAFLSDIHIGSYTFLEKRWENMVRWLKENCIEKQINYIIMPGDVVDGIGIFPGQEEELVVSDIYKQYETLAEYLKEIPDHIKMVVHPGNHDACRPAEPQPALNKVFSDSFDSNVMMLGNPVFLEIEGRKILTYHGRSIDDWVAGVQQLTYDDPLAVMREMMNSRHLAPIYGQKTALAPEKKDFMAVETVPDIFVSGHVHGYGYMEYNGIKMINASTWQDQTEYQKMHNFNPKPGIMPMVHLGTGLVTKEVFN